MTTTVTPRHSIKVKCLTLLELYPTNNDRHHTSSRNTAQILTRRIYLHPLTLNSNAKQQSSKILANNLLKIDQSNLEKTSLFSKNIPFNDRSISSSLSLTTRSNSKTASSIVTDTDTNNEFETSTITSSFNQINLPSISRNSFSIPKKRTVSTRSLYVPKKRTQKTSKDKLDVWHYLYNTLERPLPRDPPTTPLDYSRDIDLQYIQQLEF
ncbi:unnamed protein product [Adineta steineri]|uniref:Uncharacterized protein n=1 Tax=Adineta steineri TaxID=433720 RepID=A0A814ZAH0_9BILA|nr:unnamed protein product [Adineta steineri]CAF1242528.1 unnamed protein product [Adineta steineri]